MVAGCFLGGQMGRCARKAYYSALAAKSAKARRLRRGTTSS